MQSLHEAGLALDISVDGALIVDHENPAFIWLSERAADFGLKNLDSEPWPWSVSGG